MGSASWATSSTRIMFLAKIYLIPQQHHKIHPLNLKLQFPHPQPQPKNPNIPNPQNITLKKMHNLPESPPFHTIQTPISNCHLFRIPLPQIQAHANSLPSKYFSNYAKYTRICYLVITDDLDQVAKVDNGLAQIQRGDGFDFGIVVFQDQGQVQEYVGMLGKMGGFEFEQQYEQVMVMVQKMLENEAIQGVLREQLGWSQSKITHFMERQKIENISQFLSFRGFNQLEEIALTKIRNCINNMVNDLT